MENISCALTGHRRLDGRLNLEELERALIYLIENDGVNTFYDGMAMGFDLTAAKLILKLKKEYNLKLIACIPCKGQDRAFSESDKIDYAEVLNKCDDVVILSDRYYNGCMQVRDRYMVDNASVVLAFLRENKGGTYYTVKYAEKKRKKIIII